MGASRGSRLTTAHYSSPTSYHHEQNFRTVRSRHCTVSLCRLMAEVPQRPDLSQPPLVLTMGEPGGIGPDVTVTVWTMRDALRLPPFYCLSDPDMLAERARQLGVDCPIEVVTPADAAACIGTALPVVRLDKPVKATPGQLDSANAPAVIEAIARAVGDVRSGAASAIVTNPINKKALYDAGFNHPGHTEFLGTLSTAWTGKPGTPVMMLAGPDLKAVPVTIHIPLKDVPSVLTEALIVDTTRVVATDLRRRFAIAQPRLAVAGLNPHAGEGGALGDEEERIVRPAIAALRESGIEASGPHSADAMFHPAARTGYDAAICMYHDQALIPAKTLSFAETVNVTLGLAFVRTSPDHGTALDIAGTGKADPASLGAALQLAGELIRNQAAA
jgi:4-hydroxythreonine-4-phosphate dehydrogenase